LRVAAGRTGGVGFRRRRSHDVVEVETCLVAHPAIEKLLGTLRVDDEVMIRVSASTGEMVAWSEPDRMSGLSDAVGRGPLATIDESVAGRSLRVSASSFFQSSPAVASALVERVTVALGDPAQWGSGPLIDAYGGIGLFAAAIDGREVVVVEANPAACADARHNLRDRVARVVESTVENWVPEPAGAVIADPSRDGLRAAGVEVLVATNAPVIVLVSCDPASLGRDARLLVEAGYDLEWCDVVDAFPHTHHVEAVSRFVRRERLSS
jgi:23S rRNA (uracil1939-C5)-methyltransferase